MIDNNTPINDKVYPIDAISLSIKYKNIEIFKFLVEKNLEFYELKKYSKCIKKYIDIIYIKYLENYILNKDSNFE